MKQGRTTTSRDKRGVSRVPAGSTARRTLPTTTVALVLLGECDTQGDTFVVVNIDTATQRIWAMFGGLTYLPTSTVDVASYMLGLLFTVPETAVPRFPSTSHLPWNILPIFLGVMHHLPASSACV